MSRKVRILGPLPPPYGGVSVYVNRLRELLPGRGVKIWSYPHKDRREGDVEFFKHRSFGIIPLLLRDGYRARVLDCSHFHLEYPNPVLLPIWLFLKTMLGIEWIKVIHDGSLPDRSARFNAVERMLFKLGARHVDRFVVVHDELGKWLEQQIRAQTIDVIPALLPVAEHALNQSLSPEFQSTLAGYLTKAKRVCSIGVFIPEYGFKHVAEAVEALRREMDMDIGLVLLDGRFARDEIYRADVLRGRDWITVLEDVRNEEVFPILKASDVFVRAFGQESYGISRVEAIWCGVPVVATNVGETRGMLVYKFGEVESLKRQLRRTLLAPRDEELKHYADLFRADAEKNLQALKEILGVK